MYRSMDVYGCTDKWMYQSTCIKCHWSECRGCMDCELHVTLNRDYIKLK